MAPIAYDTLIRKIENAPSCDAMPDTAAYLPPMVKRLQEEGTAIELINRLMNTVAETVYIKCIRMALETSSEPPPAKFLFLLLGSSCRKEQTIKTDQDNAILFEDVSLDRQTEIQEWFLHMGQRVSRWLHHAGYNYCEGNIMASNPIWCQPVKAYEGYFSKWINEIEPDVQLRFGALFDFKGIYGEKALEARLRNHVTLMLKESRGFFRFMSEIAANYKTPLTRLGNLVLEKAADGREVFDLKAAMEPFVFIARLLAYKYDVDATNTEERFSELVSRKIISPEDFRFIIFSYRTLMRQRIAGQIYETVHLHQAPTNHVDPDRLTPQEQQGLRQALRALKKLKRYVKKVKADDSWSLSPKEVHFDP